MIIVSINFDHIPINFELPFDRYTTTIYAHCVKKVLTYGNKLRNIGSRKEVHDDHTKIPRPQKDDKPCI